MNNIAFIVSHPHLDVKNLSVAIDSDGRYVLVERNWLIQLINVVLNVFNTHLDCLLGIENSKREQMLNLMHVSIEHIENHGIYQEVESMTLLFHIVQQYHQQLEANHNRILQKLAWTRPISSGVLRDRLSAKKIMMSKTDCAIGLYIDNHIDLQPHVTRERYTCLRGIQDHYHYDQNNVHCDHTQEARNIFFHTQWERFRGVFNPRYRYNSRAIPDEDIYANDMPLPADFTSLTSYWVGHATCLLNVPVQTDSENVQAVSSICILTDPVFGDLHPLLYPRMTRVGKSLDQLPQIDLVLLSHDHRDHLEVETIRALVKIHAPYLIVPTGVKSWLEWHGIDGDKIVELGWWEKIQLGILQDKTQFRLDVTLTPSNHWSGRYGCDRHETLFGGYVLESQALDGAIYFAGDTARIKESHLKQLRSLFHIRYQFQPGGPDEMRKDMQSTHQASVDALWMHFEITVLAVYEQIDQYVTCEQFIAEVGKYATVLMHTKTYKLGNIHLSDTEDSFNRVYDALELLVQNQKCRDIIYESLALLLEQSVHINKTDLIHNPQIASMKIYEQQVLWELLAIGKRIFVLDQQQNIITLAPQHILEILRLCMIVPKIGSRTLLYQKKN